MRFCHRLYHFLGGVYFALILIGAVALFVIAGTFIESLTKSHRYAALFTYDNPVFAALLWGFFINILFSAIRRWPFQWKHIPFLVTHLGLLMILGGVLAKHYFGVQGSMSLSEGTGSHQILEANTYAIHVNKKNSMKGFNYPLQKTIGGSFRSDIAQEEGQFTLLLAEFYPHSKEYLESWIKGSHVTINGLKPMPLHVVNSQDDELPVGGRVRFLSLDATAYHLYALKTEAIEKALTRLYTQHARLKISSRLSGAIVLEASLKDLLFNPLNSSNRQLLALDFSLDFSLLEGFKKPSLKMTFNTNERLEIPLNGPHALFNLNRTNPKFGHLPFAVDILMQPVVAFIEDQFEDVFLIVFDAHGKVWSESFRKGDLNALFAYDEGFSGYTTRQELPLKAYETGRQIREQTLTHDFMVQLRQAVAEGTELSPPLHMMSLACQKAQIDFPSAAATFLENWNGSNNWLYQEELPLPLPLNLLFSNLDWKDAPPHIKQGCKWLKTLFDQFDPDLKKHDNLLSILSKNRWPAQASLQAQLSLANQTETNPCEFTLFTQQVFAAAEALPCALTHEQEDLSSQFSKSSPWHQASLFSAYLRAYGIHFAALLEVPSEDAMNQLIHSYHAAKLSEIAHLPRKDKDLVTQEKDLSATVTLETVVKSVQEPMPSGHKLEDNLPKITLYVREGTRSQSLSLAYDRTGTGLKWPVLDGDYLLRFQPLSQDIPYHLRLRQARQINYPNSSQPYSFESDLIVKDLRTNLQLETTISMNCVHETWDGYRFYLSSIAPPNETDVKQVQIIVNYDPAKYLLTYPGAIVLSCGMLMLFSMRPYRRPKN